MKIDPRLLTGILLGIVFGLHYHAALLTYLPLIMIGTVIMVLKHVVR